MKELKNLIVEKTLKTPQIELNQLTGELILSGKSIPENAARIYEPVFLWVTDYILDPKQTTNLRFDLEYFNTASSIWFAKILKALVKINEPDYILFIHVYLPIEDFDEMNDVDDIKDAFSPVTDIFISAIPSIGLKIYGTADDGEIIKDRLVFI